MSEGFAAPPPPEPAARKRPATVTVAGLLMLLVALISVIYLVSSLAVLGSMTEAFEEAYAGTDLADSAGFLAATTVISGAVYLLFGIALAILTIFNNQGRNGARITTWVVGGIGLCCGGLSLIGTALGDFTAGMGGPEDQNLPDTEEVVSILEAHMPGWYDPLIMTATVVGVLALAVGLLLLALPPSNEFFRKPKEQFEPPPPGYPQVG